MSTPHEPPLREMHFAMTTRQPTDEERELHRLVCVEGRFVHDVAAKNGLAVEHLERIIRRVQRWLLPTQEAVDARSVRALHLARLEHQWREAMAAWYRSGRQAEMVKVSREERDPKAAGGAMPPAASPPPGAAADGKASAAAKQRVERVYRDTCGDVRYLEQARRILKEHRALADAMEQFTTERKNRDVQTLKPHERDAMLADGGMERLERKRDGQDGSADPGAG